MLLKCSVEILLGAKFFYCPKLKKYQENFSFSWKVWFLCLKVFSSSNCPANKYTFKPNMSIWLMWRWFFKHPQLIKKRRNSTIVQSKVLRLTYDSSNLKFKLHIIVKSIVWPYCVATHFTQSNKYLDARENKDEWVILAFKCMH